LVGRFFSSWVVAFMREGIQTGLFVWYVIASALVLVLLPGDLASDLIVVSATGILMVAAILVRLRRRRRSERRENHGRTPPTVG
jgi:hypothetical protein